MSDIFISYSSLDRARVKILVEALERQGLSVWWDRDIPPGKTYDQVIHEALGAAKCVIVVWSKESVQSEWVKDEADEGKRRRILVPVLIDDVEPPLGFRRIQAASLVDWQGELPHPGFEQLSEAVTETLSRSAPKVDKSGQLEPDKSEKPVSLRKELNGRYEGKNQEGDSYLIQEKAGTQDKKRPVIFAAAGIAVLIILGVIAYYVLSHVKYPEINSFTASPETVKRGDKATLSWRISNAKEVEIIGIGNVPLSGTQTVSLSETTTYILIAENGEGKAVKGKITVQVSIPPSPPEISYFSASPPIIKKGDSSTLSWEASNAKEVEIVGIGKVALSGTQTVSPTETASYTLITKNEEGMLVQRDVKVEVKTPIPPPEILGFSVEPVGDGFKLIWQTLNANEVEISGIGRVEPSGSSTVNPAETATYVLVARNEEGKEAESETTVKIDIPIKAPEIDHFRAASKTINKGESSTLSWQTSNADEVEISGIGKVSSSGSKTVKPAITTTYTLTAGNEAGKEVEEKITVRVQTPPPLLPEIAYFTAGPAKIKKGEQSTLSWKTSNADEVEISGIGKVELSGERKVSPAETTTYTLELTDEEGKTVDRRVTVEVEFALPPITVVLTDNEKKLTNKTEFRSGAETIHAVINLTKAPPGALLRALWISETDAGDSEFYEQTHFIKLGDQVRTTFSIKQSDWLPGSYRIELYLGGSPLYTARFRVLTP